VQPEFRSSVFIKRPDENAIRCARTIIYHVEQHHRHHRTVTMKISNARRIFPAINPII